MDGEAFRLLTTLVRLTPRRRDVVASRVSDELSEVLVQVCHRRNHRALPAPVLAEEFDVLAEVGVCCETHGFVKVLE